MKQEIEPEQIALMFKKVIYAGGNILIFNVTLIVFRIVSYTMAILWILIGIGYIFHGNDGKSLNSLTDIVSTAVSTFLLLLILIVFPTVFSFVRKRIPVPIKKNGCPLYNVEKELLSDTRISKKDFFKTCLNPRLMLIKNGSKLEIKYEQRLPLNQYKVLWVLRNLEGKELFLQLDIKKLLKYQTELLKFEIFRLRSEKKNKILQYLRKGKEIENPISILRLFAQVNQSHSKVYFQSKDNDEILVASITQRGNQYAIGDIEISSVEGDIASLLKENQEHFLIFKNGDKKTSYVLKEVVR
ncbi:hypothetical protein [Bacillus thuringiensis]|uniref:hypothetical protein n=1 Tax=Bacillus thuringiensis TaxID=1428 RepID=UPI0011A83739|nr:hypothetical protein [Bacillus thuringiensis]MCU5437823.1 hypothetical protein [Bacillus cereus]